MSAQPQSAQRFNVFKVRYGPVINDPDLPGTRFHTVIFVETSADGSGHIHHVTGDLVTGMQYQAKPSRRPEESQTFSSKDYIGTVSANSYPSAVDSVCRAQRPPPPQKAFNKTTMRTEQVKPDGTFYGAHEDRPALFKCTEWTEQSAIPALREKQVLQATPPITSSTRTAQGSASVSPWIWDSQHRRYRRLQGGSWVWAP